MRIFQADEMEQLDLLDTLDKGGPYVKSVGLNLSKNVLANLAGERHGTLHSAIQLSQ